MPGDIITLPPGTVIAGYEIECDLGAGNNGVVYRARQQALDRQIALKILLPELASEPEYVKSFLSEARLAARLDHPHIVQAYDAGGTPEGLYFFAMELVRGCSVEDIRRNTPERLTLPFIYRLSAELADALQYAWQQHKMTHGDIKPGNLLIADDGGTLKLADLGLARIGETGKIGEEIMATPLYVAPEVIRGDHGEFGVRSDLYSFGIMLYELLCGTPPFTGKPEDVILHHLNTEPMPLLVRNPDLDRPLAEFVTRLISKNAAERPGSWAEVRTFFSDIRNRKTVSLPADVLPKTWERKEHSISRYILQIVLLIFALGAASCLIYLGITIFRSASSAAPPELSAPVPEEKEPEPQLPPVPPELSVALSSPPARPVPPVPAKPEVPKPEVQPETPKPVAQPEPPKPAPQPKAPEPVPEPQPEAPKPEPQPETPKPEERQPPPPRTSSFDFNPRINESRFRQRYGETNRILMRLGSNFSSEWKAEAGEVIAVCYRLQMQMELRGLKSKVIDRISINPGGASWISNGPQSGTLRISPDEKPIEIASQLGKGLFEANRGTLKLSSGMKDEFAEAFRYFVEQRLRVSETTPSGNRFLDNCHHSLPMFVQMLTNERQLDQLRRLR